MTNTDDCICAGNWRAIVREYESLIGTQYRDQQKREWLFFGLVHGGDDFYYGMSSAGGKLALLSCVGSIEGYGFEPIAAPGRTT